MRPDEARKYMKRGGIASAFFLLSLVLYLLGMGGALIFYALLTAVVLVLMILIQSGRGGGLAALGGMDSEAVLGTHSATPIAKATYVVGALFIFTCMLSARLGLTGRSGGKTDINPGALPKQKKEAPSGKKAPIQPKKSQQSGTKSDQNSGSKAGKGQNE